MPVASSVFGFACGYNNIFLHYKINIMSTVYNYDYGTKLTILKAMNLVEWKIVFMSVSLRISIVIIVNGTK